ncbi:cytochrome P450 [Coniophora puteana RWD-64-598 SS2]|uniref:Cytochrome P450 n=1 Tax=Coniophora puteana (strain RWD-64-598) TaxID=741705 RepID=A0A5M3MVF0_CONPW|nr:cytochrome P450 [Coniophora puteana RWD-64-598 SS2]EIW82685.1 cytochrome P450 [Coniophora puteana RWD-64-598 SS2]
MIRLFLKKLVASKPTLKNPPGPKGIPVLGSVLSLMHSRPWETFAEWGTRYGDLVFCSLAGKPVLIINSERVARELLDKRSHIYSDRPQLSHYEYSGIGASTSSLPYGSDFKMHARLLCRVLKRDATSSYQRSQVQRSHQLLAELHMSPFNFDDHLRNFTASAITALTYGYEAVSAQDNAFCKPMIELVDQLRQGMAPARAVLMSAFPILQRIPPWFPRAIWQRDAQRTRELMEACRKEPFAWVKEQLASGKTLPPSLVGDLLQAKGDASVSDAEYAKVLKDVAATMFIGLSLCESNSLLSDTTSLLMAFFLTIVTRPDVQKRAQAEIDAQLGAGNLPTFADRPKLPYVEAVLREVLRMYVILPLALPHSTSADDVYNGYFIPKGTLVLPNTWHMVRSDPKWSRADSDTEAFDPTRHLASCGTLLPTASPADIANSPVFGFGRRRCPGRFVAENALWIAMAGVLAAFDVSPVDKSSINAKVEMHDANARTPVVFPCVAAVRRGWEGAVEAL